MTEAAFKRAKEVYEELQEARKRLSDIDGLLSLSGKNSITLKSSATVLPDDVMCPSSIKFDEVEFNATLKTLKDIRLTRVENLESKLLSIKD
jgi:hypothetical protein